MKMKQNENNNVMDERQSQIMDKALASAGVFAVLCLTVATVVRIVTTGDAGWELFAIVGYCLVLLIANRKFGNIEAPEDVWGKPMPTGDSKEERRIRKKNYALGSLAFAAAWAVMDVILILLGKTDVTDFDIAKELFPNVAFGWVVVVTAVIAFVSMFAVSYTFDYLIGEKYKVKRYNEMIARLDEEEEE